MANHYVQRFDLSKYTLKSFDSVNEICADSNASDQIKYDGGGTARTLVTTDHTQTLTNKTLTTPTLNTPGIAFNVASVTAAGTDQTTSTAITAAVPAIITVTAADTTKGVTLPASTTGALYWMQNSVTDKNLNVWPAAGEVINALSSNTSYVLAGAKTAVFACEAAGTWFTILTA